MKIHLLSLFISTIIVVSICFFTLNTYGSIIFILSFVLSAYGSKLLEYKSLSINKKYSGELVYKYGYPKVKYDTFVELRKIADSRIWAPKLLSVSIPFLIIQFMHLINIEDIMLYLIFIVGIMLGSLTHLNDYKNLIKIWIAKNDSFHIEFNGFNVKAIKTEGVKSFHKDAYFYEQAYKDYKIADLKRELRNIEQDIFDEGKKGFWDKYLVPILFLITTSTIGFINIIISGYINMKEYPVENVVKNYFIILILIVTILIQIFSFKHLVIKPSKSNLMLIKLTLVDLIYQKNKNDT